MQWNNYTQYILKEGYQKILTTFGISFLLLILGFSFFAKVGFLLTLALLWIYRNDLKKAFNPSNLEGTIYSPIDGRISGIDFIDGIFKIYIDVNLCGNHILRAPTKGAFSILSNTKGLNLSSWSFKGKLLNAQADISFVDSNNELTKIKAIGGTCGTNISLDADKKDVKTSDKIGVFTQGIIILELPKSYELTVKIGEVVSSGVSVLGSRIGTSLE
jgi:phosphatidylserine decarboxylase